MAAIERRLGDLYVTTSEPVEFLDPEGAAPIVVYMRKLSDADEDTAERRAAAARARVMSAQHDRDSDIYRAFYSDALDFERDVLVEFVLSEPAAKLRMSIDSELQLGEDSEWGKDGYLQALSDAWTGMDEGDGLQEAWLDEDDPRHPAAVQTFREMERFRDEVDAVFAPQYEDMKRRYDSVSDDDLLHEVVKAFFSVGGERAWLLELQKCIVWLGTFLYDPSKAAGERKTRERYFASRVEVEHLPNDMLARLQGVYKEMSVDVLEGKGLPGNPASSPASASPDAAATAPASGLATVGA